MPRDGRATGDRSCRARAGHLQRHGARPGYGFASRRAGWQNGYTVAVFGTGVDAPYPKQNTRLSAQILASGGALISEFAMGYVSRAAEFSDSQSHQQRHSHRRAGRRDSRLLGNAYPDAVRARAIARCARKCSACAGAAGGDESKEGENASLFANEQRLSPHESRIYSLLKADESTPISEIVERLDSALSSSEIFAALFELELAGKVRQLPGKNFVRSW